MKATRGTDILREIKIRYPHAKRVVDAVKPLTFSMAPEHMTGCKRNDAAHCPVHKRLNDLLETPTIVLHETAYVVQDDGDIVRYKFEERLKEAVDKYDSGKKFRPGFYKLRPPSPTRRLGTPHKTKGTTSGRHAEIARLRRAVRRQIDQ